MTRLSLFVIFVSGYLNSLPFIFASGSCDYHLQPSSICYNILDYAPSSPVYLSNSCGPSSEFVISTAAQVWSSIAPSNSTCLNSIASFMCQSLFPKCTNNNTAPTPICKSQCTNIANNCPNVDLALLSSLLSFNFDCSVNNNFNDNQIVDDTLNTCMKPMNNNNNHPLNIPSSSCVAYGSLPPLAYDVCYGLLGADYPVYIPPMGSVSLARFELDLIQFSFAALPTTCSPRLALLLCSRHYPRCGYNQVGPYSVPYPSAPCQSECNEVMSVFTCGLVFPVMISKGGDIATLGKTLTQNCSVSVASSINPYPASCNHPTTIISNQYPVNTTAIFPVAPFTAPSNPSVKLTSLMGSCSVPTSSQLAPSSFQVRCPTPLVLATKPENGLLGGSCAQPCLFLLFSPAEWDLVNLLMQVLSSIDIIFATFTWLTWVIFPTKRKQTYVLCFTTCVFINEIFLFSNAVGGNGASNSCSAIDTIVHQSDTGNWPRFCVLSGFVFHYNSLACMFWWLVIAFDLFLKVHFNQKLNATTRRNLNIFYHVMSWGVPAVFAIPAFALGLYGGLQGIGFCIISDDTYLWSLFFGIVSAIMILVIIIMIAILYELWKSAQVTSGSKAGKWKRHIRPMLFLTQFFFIFLFLVAFRIQVDANKGSYTDSATDWVTCILGNNPSSCGSNPPLRPTMGIWYGVHISAVVQGIFLFFVYGTQADSFALWRHLILGSTSFISKTGVDTSDTGSDGPSTFDKSSQKSPHHAQSVQKRQATIGASRFSGGSAESGKRSDKDKTFGQTKAQNQKTSNQEASRSPVHNPTTQNNNNTNNDNPASEMVEVDLAKNSLESPTPQPQHTTRNFV